MSLFHLPESCRHRQFNAHCTLLVSLLTGSFERGSLLKYNDLMLQRGDDRLPPLVTATQEVTVTFTPRPRQGYGVFGLTYRRHLADGTVLRFVEAINLDLKTGRALEFSELFAQPELAAAICARQINDHFAPYREPLLPAVVAAYDLQPRNFSLSAAGITFRFAPGQVSPDPGDQTLTVKLADLRPASPDYGFFAPVSMPSAVPAGFGQEQGDRRQDERDPPDHP